MRNAILLLTATCLCLGSDCQGNLPAGQAIPGGQDAVSEGQGAEPSDEAPTREPCFTTFWSDLAGAGFNVPDGLSAPALDSEMLDAGFYRMESFRPGEVHPDLSFYWRSTDRTFEEAAAYVAQLAASGPPGEPLPIILHNEPITLNGGQPGWVIASMWRNMPSLMFVKVQLVWDKVGEDWPIWYSLSLTGHESEGTNDYEYLLGVGRTLCAE